MASKPGSDANQTDTQGKGDRLPFEPSSGRKRERRKEAAANSAAPAKSVKASKPKSSTPKATAKNGQVATSSKAETQTGKAARTSKASAKQSEQRRKYSREETAIPEAVSQRMIKRMAVLCGVPTVLGISTFVISYFIVSNGVIDLPPVAVLLVSLGFFGLGVLGISYGALSTSWDVHYEGSALGWTEFKLNFGRMRQAWKESREQNRS